MNPIKTFDELRTFNMSYTSQYWYYVILFNPHDLTAAGKAVIDNLNIFHLDSGSECHYFIPGFENTGSGLLRAFFPTFGTDSIDVPNFGRLKFFEREFVEFYKKLEMNTYRGYTGWRYSSECELLIFNLDGDGKIDLVDFTSYNLDDIVRNGRSVSEFIRTTINVGKDAKDKTSAKNRLDEKYYEMIMPNREKVASADYKKGWDMLQLNGFTDNNYYFISYSTRDYSLVSDIRDKLMENGISCWMAPYDIPSGTNYAWIIEHAISHAGKFVLMLSENAVESVWVGKELKRAITLFQQESPEKLCAVWLDHVFSLSGTPFALPLEDVQINVDLKGTSENYMMIVDGEKSMKSEALRHRAEIERLLRPETNTESLRELLEHIHAIARRKMSFLLGHGEAYDLHKRIKEEIEAMNKSEHIYDREYLSHYNEAVNLIRILLDMLQK